jgi:hypothetical protein
LKYAFLYFLQIGFGAIVFYTNPKRSDLSTKANNARNLAIFGGLVPCWGLMIFPQIFWLVMYRGMLGREVALHNRLQGGLPTSFGSSGRPTENPPEEPRQEKTAKPPSDNPFL